jgi:hypothetical protein
VVVGSAVGGGVVVTASVCSVVEPQENGLYQAICYKVSFYLFGALCSNSGQNVSSEESNSEDD